jgi:hypothetical protein
MRGQADTEEERRRLVQQLESMAKQAMSNSVGTAATAVLIM